MKKFIVRLTLLCVLLGMSFNDTAMAQYRRYGRPSHHSHYRGDGFFRALDAAESIGEAAVLGSMLHHIDDYTGFRIGYNAASLRTDIKGLNVNSEFTPGLNVGFVFGWRLGRNTPFLIEPGLYYSMNGGKLRVQNEDIKITMHNLEIPLVLKAQLPLSPDGFSSLQPFFGGFLSYGFAGKLKEEYYKEHDTWDIYDEGLFSTVDAGLRMGVGLNVGAMYLEFAYDLGLVNLPEREFSYQGFMNFDDYHDTMRSNTLSFSIGVNF